MQAPVASSDFEVHKSSGEVSTLFLSPACHSLQLELFVRLQRVVLLGDSAIGLQQSDKDRMKEFDTNGTPYQVHPLGQEDPEIQS